MIDPATVEGAVIWGVVSGLATSALLLILGLLASKVVLPAYTEFIYKMNPRNMDAGNRHSARVLAFPCSYRSNSTPTRSRGQEH